MRLYINLGKAAAMTLLTVTMQFLPFDGSAEVRSADAVARDKYILRHDRLSLKSEYALPIRIYLKYERKNLSNRRWEIYKTYYTDFDKWTRADIEKDFDLGYIEVNTKTQFSYVGPPSALTAPIYYYMDLFNRHRRLTGPSYFYKWCDQPETVPCWVDIPGPNAIIFFVAHLSLGLELTIDRIEEFGDK